jgi:benzoyl-CoA reductase/2-hydroxyglutaryl-CoA dehydratase subunit BcrC/BadD/HgdB
MSLQGLSFFRDSYDRRIAELRDEKANGKKIIGTFCLFVPDEIIFAAGADRVVLCGGSTDTIPIAERSLPRNICPLVKSSFGALIDACCGGSLACPHVGLVDVVVAEATCDAKKKMYELLEDVVPTYVMDLPQKPSTPRALDYFTEELRQFGAYLEEQTGITITDEALRKEIRSANETRRLLQRFFDFRRRDPPPITGMDVLFVMQKQFFLSPTTFREGVRSLCDEMEALTPSVREGPRIMISGCPLPGGTTKIAEIIEQNGGVIVVEESCTGTRSFADLVDEDNDPWTALARRYLDIPCACMTPNERRTVQVVDLAKRYHVDGVVYYTLQSCHGYNIERTKVQKALKQEKIPLLAIESDYGNSDVEQIGIRVNAFMEMIA